MVNSESKTKQHDDFLTAAIHSKSIAADKLQHYKRIQCKPTLWRPHKLQPKCTLEKETEMENYVA